jgi:4'-phosphopantetheinyl transferase EntD
VSISHLCRRHPSGCVGVVAVAACRGAGIGLDIVAPAEIVPASLARFLTPHERAMTSDPHGAAVVWAAKEAAFKASGLDEGFRPRRVVIDQLTARGFAWRVRGDFRAVVGEGGFLLADDHVLAIAVADRIPDRIADHEKNSSPPLEESNPTP